MIGHTHNIYDLKCPRCGKDDVRVLLNEDQLYDVVHCSFCKHNDGELVELQVVGTAVVDVSKARTG